jgi:hypothetical protein
MKTNELILSVILSASIFVPIFYVIFVGNKRKNSVTSALAKLAGSLNLSITESDIWGDKALGYDKVKKILIFISIKGNQSIEQQIDFQTVVRCKLLNNPTFVALQLFKMDSTIETMELYNTNEDALFEAEQHINMGKKWIVILDKKIPFRPNKVA